MLRLSCVALWMAAAISVTNGQKCESDEYLCADGSRCVSASSQFCNGARDCRDGSDEPVRNISIKYDANQTFCRGRFGDICVLRADLATRLREHCSEYGVEIKCKEDEFSCTDGSGCFSESRFCDGIRDCRDGSDEPSRNINIKYDANQTFCRGADGYICVFRADLATSNKTHCSEFGVGLQCRSDEFSCTDGSRCIEVSSFCDDSRNCRDGSDEPPLRNISIKYDANQIFCRGRNGHICALRASHATSFGKHCSESRVDLQCRSDEFPCTDGSRCLGASSFCDGYRDCRDGSDEIREYSRHFQYNSRGSSCLNIRTGFICTVPTGVDPKKLEICQTTYLGRNRFGCLSKPTTNIPISNVCNGKFDCPDGSDECLCSTTMLDIYQPPTSGEKEPDFSEPKETSDYQCSRQQKAAMKCDGIPECKYFFDEECNCTETPEFCDTVIAYAIGSINFRGYSSYDWKHFNYWEYLHKSSTKCGSSGPFLFGDNVCNGVTDCKTNYADESGCEASRFYCERDPGPNIPFAQICDGNEDCPNGRDEMNTGTHFCCNDNGSLNYIPRSRVCDGIQDCKSGIDECQKCISSGYPDDTALISSKPLLAFVWIISLVALFGCLAVVNITAYVLVKAKKTRGGIKSTGHAKLIQIFVSSLAMSDVLVAVYTLIICIKALQLNEKYCLADRIWRSSNTCSALGIILIIGSEQSVFTMVLIASHRLSAVLRPFSHPNICRAVITVIASWLISIVLALIPLISPFEDYFKSSVMFSENKIFKEMHHNDTQYMIDWLSLMYENLTIGKHFGVTDWGKIRNLTAEINPNIKMKYEFGYYSGNSACLPTFFPDPSNDAAWQYTLLLLLINLFAFLFIAVCYIILYRHASNTKVMEQSNAQQRKRDKQNAKMQRKLTRIVVTDFLCWMPICVMGFLQLSGVKIPEDAYLLSGLIALPINSALNPLLYSDLPEILMKRLELARQSLRRYAESLTETIEMT